MPKQLTRVVAALVLVTVGGPLAGVETGAVAKDDPDQPKLKAKGSTQLAGCDRALRLENAEFPEQPDIDNTYLPLQPGTRLTLVGTSNVTGAPLDHQVTFTVTDLTKQIAGVSSVVVYDVDTSGGVVSEAELAFFAQDEDGNVWNLGEYPEEYENGEFVGAPSTWIAGTGNAQAGIHMLADPVLDGPVYLQGWAPKIHFLDCAAVVAEGETATPPAGTFTDVLVTEEINPYEPQGGSQLKYHAPGVGIVRVGFVDDPEGEVLELVSAEQLSSAQMAGVNAAACALDERAYEEAEVYQDTGPADCPGR